MDPTTAAQAANAASEWDWAQFGISGLVIGALFIGVWQLLKLHREERQEWRSDLQKMLERSDTRTEKLGIAIESLDRSIRDGLKG